MKETQMARIFVTGSAQGLGRSAATNLIDHGHQVVVHARDPQRAAALADLADRGAAVVVGDLASDEQTRRLADQVNDLGRMDAIIHNAAVYGDTHRNPGPEGHPRVLAVNSLAPYLLTGLIERPDRLIYLTSDMHLSGDDSLRDLDWTARRWNGTQAYCDSKLFVTTIAFAVARRWPAVISNAVDPGWVPTRMGGPGAPDDLEKGHLTQVWLAVSDDSEANRSGEVWYHHRRARAASAARSIDFQDRLLNRLAELTGFELPDAPAGRP
jgi:NAD(P)-dependent dehydrogenase (short-subunit alcohol dehydrogenase family)